MQGTKRRSKWILPDDLRQKLDEMGFDIATARRVRNISQDGLANQIQVSRKVVARMEKGDPTVSFGSYVMAATVMGLDGNLTGIFAKEKDPVFQERALQAVKQRARSQKSKGGNCDE